MKHWIGIDTSKLTLDLALLGFGGMHLESVVVENRPKALLGQIAKWQKHYAFSTDEFMVCIEPTGRYSDEPVRSLVSTGIKTWLAHPMDIQKSIGSTRGKNDKVDALRIADYARRFEDKARFLSSAILRTDGLKQLISKRGQLTRTKAMLKAQIKEHNKLVLPELRKEFDRVDRMQLTAVVKALKQLEALIKKEVEANKELHAQYELLLSVSHVGPVLASHVLAFTSGFVRFTSARQFACYTGLAPFSFSSGSSVRGKTRTSPQAQQGLKSLLHMSAIGAIKQPGELQDYWLRKLKEGKPKMSILNAIRNKIVHRMYAVLKRGLPYEKVYTTRWQAAPIA